jgi:hypothetical protein
MFGMFGYVKPDTKELLANTASAPASASAASVIMFILGTIRIPPIFLF